MACSSTQFVLLTCYGLQEPSGSVQDLLHQKPHGGNSLALLSPPGT